MVIGSQRSPGHTNTKCLNFVLLLRIYYLLIYAASAVLMLSLSNIISFEILNTVTLHGDSFLRSHGNVKSNASFSPIEDSFDIQS